MDPITIGVISSLIAAGIAGGFGYLVRGERYRRRIDSAPEQYVSHLGRLIETAKQEGFTRAVVNARAIVAARNDLRRSLMSIPRLLNSDIDTLQRELAEEFDVLSESAQQQLRAEESEQSQRPRGDTESSSQETRKIDKKVIYQTIEVLHKKWPAKRDQIRIAIRKLIAEMGLDSA